MEAHRVLLFVSAVARDFISGMIMLCDILGESLPLAFTLRIVVLLAMLKEAILSGIVVTCDLRRVVCWPIAMLRVDGFRSRFRCVRRVIELLVARVVLVTAIAFTHGSLCGDGIENCRATAMPNAGIWCDIQHSMFPVHGTRSSDARRDRELFLPRPLA